MKALNELGFYWGIKTKSDMSKSFEKRIEDLKAFHAKHLAQDDESISI